MDTQACMTSDRQAVYDAGHRDGYSAAQTDVIAQANQEMLKQMAFTRQYAADKAVLAKQLEKARNEIAALRAELALKEEERCNQAWQNNRLMVFGNAMRATLEDLVINGNAAIKGAFTQRYQHQVEKALANRTLLTPLEKDEAFANALPKAHRFIAEMLSATGV